MAITRGIGTAAMALAAGSNSYDSDGSDPMFFISSADGSGNNATVEFSAPGL